MPATANEFEEMLAIERERARGRQGQRTDLEEHSGNVSKKSTEAARDKAAEKVPATANEIEEMLAILSILSARRFAMLNLSISDDELDTMTY